MERYTQVGVVSGSDSCDDPKIPDVFIRVGEASIKKWIKEVSTGTQDSMVSRLSSRTICTNLKDRFESRGEEEQLEES